MIISFICNIVTFISVCVILYNWRKLGRSYKEQLERYDELHREHLGLVRVKEKLWWEKYELENKVKDLEKTIKDLDMSNEMETIGDYKDKIRAVTESYERQHKFHVFKLYMDEDGITVKM